MHPYILYLLCVLLAGAISPVKAEQIRVTPGDTLWDIAERKYGDPFLWHCIHKANPELINPNLLMLPSTVVIPEKWECIRNQQLVSDRPKSLTPSPSISKPKPSVPKTAAKQSNSQLPLVPQSEETTVFNDGGYQLVPVKMIVDQERRSASIKTMKVDSTTLIDGKLLRTLMPKDPRVSRTKE